MKNLFIALVTLSSMTAFANGNELTCSKVVGADMAYSFHADITNMTARLEASTIAGHRLLANLYCRQVPQRPPVGADIPRVWLECAQPEARNGYYVTVSTGGFTGMTTAEIYQVYRGQAQPLAQAQCR
jgi:hypothetical protein